MTFFISNTYYQLPATNTTLGKSKANWSTPQMTLQKFGFEKYHSIESHQEFLELLHKAAKQAFSTHPSFDAVFYYSGLSHWNRKASRDFTEFEYPLSFLKNKLDITCPAFALGQAGCSGLYSILSLLNELKTKKNARYLCIFGDYIPHTFPRDILHNVMSDACSACIVENNSTSSNKIIAMHEESQHFYAETSQKQQEILAAYFPLAKISIENCLAKANLKISDVDWIVPHNVSEVSWKILAGMLQFPMEKIYTANISRVAHTISSDLIINLSDMKEQNLLKKGQKILLFSFGFGAYWSSILMEH